MSTTTPSCIIPRGIGRLATKLAALRAAAGITFAWKAIPTIHATQTIQTGDNATFMAQGLGLTGDNAANPDIRILRATPSDFALGSYPLEGDTIQITEAGGTLPYKVSRVELPTEGGGITAVQLTVYRMPPSMASENTPAGEVNPDTTTPNSATPPVWLPPTNTN